MHSPMHAEERIVGSRPIRWLHGEGAVGQHRARRNRLSGVANKKTDRPEVDVRG